MAARLIDVLVYATDRLRVFVLTLAILGLWQTGWSLAQPPTPTQAGAIDAAR